MKSSAHNIISKLPKLPESIFTTMSRLAKEHEAINISQGFPNFEADPVLIQKQ